MFKDGISRRRRSIYQKEATAFGFAARVVITILLLQVLYPNLVHEPLHLLALSSFGYTGEIVFDWSLPATPVVHYVFASAAVWQAVIVFMLPSAVNLLLIALLGSIRTRFPMFKIGVIAFLAFDLIINIRGFEHPTSDFRWIQSDALAISLIIIIIAFALWGIYKGVQRVKIVKVIKND